jgi:4-diphosphocytidyl-2-C-methyl-D-erythritol kinase
LIAAGAGALSEAAPAKLNLYLHVVGRRPDGYHELDSLVAFVEAGDALSAAPAENLSLTIEGPFAAGLSAGADNQVMKAARAFSSLSSRTSGVPTPRDPESIVPPERWIPDQVRGDGEARGAAITLTKNLPVASGIGGGSADAAATLRLLRRLWRLDMPDDALAALGLSLGADLPVCLRRRPSILRGIGEQLSDAPALPPAGLVLVNPRVPLATPDVFRRRSGPFSAPVAFAAPRDVAGLAAALATAGNDLEAPATALVPVIGVILQALRASPGCRLARLSGSGATCFGIYDDASAAEKAAAWLSMRDSGWWVKPTRWLASS